jgi:hypothetical protein
MANYFSEISKEELAEIGKKARERAHSPEAMEKQKATRERNKNFHKLARYMMEAEIPTEEDAAMELREKGFEGADYQTAVFWGQLKKAIYGLDTEAAKYVRDTAGYKPTESMQIGNLDDKPFTQIDLSKLSNEELLRMVAAREKIEE